MTTYLDMIEEVILTCKSPKGMSLQAIKRAVEALKTDGKGFQPKNVTKVLHQAVEDGVLTLVDGHRYRVTPEQRKELKKKLSPRRKSKTPSPKKSGTKPKKSTAPKKTKAKKAGAKKAKKGPAGAAKKGKKAQ